MEKEMYIVDFFEGMTDEAHERLFRNQCEVLLGLVHYGFTEKEAELIRGEVYGTIESRAGFLHPVTTILTNKGENLSLFAREQIVCDLDLTEDEEDDLNIFESLPVTNKEQYERFKGCEDVFTLDEWVK